MCKTCKTKTKAEFKSFEDLNSADRMILADWFYFFESLHLYINKPKEHLGYFKIRFFLDNPSVKEIIKNGNLSLEQILTASLHLPSAFDDVRDIWLKDFLKFFTKDESLNKDVVEYKWKHINALGNFFGYIRGLGYLTEFSNLHKAIAYEVLKTLPHVSTENPNFIAYTQNKDKLSRNIQTRTKIGRYLNTIMNNACKAVDSEVPKGFSDKLNEISQKFSIDTIPAAERVKFAENDNLDEWERVYRSDEITSCMNNDNYGITKYDTYRCYCTSAFGLDDNGLRLAYIEDEKHNPVSRAIVHEPTKSYVRVYGDDVLSIYLGELGYKEVETYPTGLKLAAIRKNDKRLYPHVDGVLFEADFIKSPNNPETDLWELVRGGNFHLQQTNGVTCVYVCPICDESHNKEHEIYYDGEMHKNCCSDCFDYSLIAKSAEYGDVYDDVCVYSCDDIIEVDGVNYLDTVETREYYGIEYSKNLGRYIKITDSN